MPSFAFSGFTAGSIVALSAAQLGNNVSNSVTSWGQGSMAQVDILTVQMDDVVAPAGIWFEADNLRDFAVDGEPAAGKFYDPSFHEITFIWSVRGAPIAQYTAPQNMVDGWNNPNLAYGKKVALAFPTAGTYTVDLWAIDALGNTATAETTVEVLSGEAVYPDARTVCFSNDPGETWAGEIANCQRATTLAELQAAINTSLVNPIRILLKGGQTVDDFYLSVSSGLLGYLGTWGGGERAIIEPRKNTNAIIVRTSSPITQFTIDNIHFQGEWDSTTELGIPTKTPLFLRDKSIGCFFGIHNCEFDGFETLALTTNANSLNTVIMSNTGITNWRDYGIFAFVNSDPDSRMALIGTRIAQHPDALNGGSKNGLHNTHGPFRYANTSNVYVAVCDFFSRCGWSALGSDTADQPCLRANYEGSLNRSLNVDRLVSEGGFKMLILEGQNGGSSGTVEHPGNYLLDKVLCIATAKTIGPYIRAEYGGTTLRNVLGITPNVPQYHQGNGWPGAIVWDPDNPDSRNADEPMAAYNCSFLNLRNSTNDLSANWVVDDGSTYFSSLTVENNVMHAPNIDSPEVGNASISMTGNIPGVTPRFRGVRFNFQGQSGSFSSAIPDGGSFSISYADITSDLVRQSGTSSTNQSYWQGLPSSDNAHFIITRNEYGNPLSFSAANGELSVSFGGSSVTITNTSGEAWYSAWSLRLDRKSQIPAMQTNFGSPSTLPLPRPQTNSNARNTGDLGYAAYDDFLGKVRPGPGGITHLGTSRPATGNEKGALLES